MGLLSFLETSDKAVEVVDNVVDNAAKGIDALWFTTEEKSKASLDVMELWVKMTANIANESSVRSLTRRYLAFAFCGIFILLLLGMTIIWPWNPTYSNYLLSVLGEIKWIITAIVIFYFGYFGVKEVLGIKKP